MKKLHLFMLKSFVGPFVATFFISMFVLIMQFLWRYIDDLVGKGLEGHVISELLFYVSRADGFTIGRVVGLHHDIR